MKNAECEIPLQFSAPTFCRDGRYYWNYNSGLQAQYVLFRSFDDQLPDFGQDKDIPAGEVFFDVCVPLSRPCHY
jgi:prolyl oligopeptidase